MNVFSKQSSYTGLQPGGSQLREAPRVALQGTFRNIPAPSTATSTIKTVANKINEDTAKLVDSIKTLQSECDKVNSNIQRGQSIRRGPAGYYIKNNPELLKSITTTFPSTEVRRLTELFRNMSFQRTNDKGSFKVIDAFYLGLIQLMLPDGQPPVDPDNVFAEGNSGNTVNPADVQPMDLD